MILLELKKYVQQQQRVSLQEIAYHFNRCPETLKLMLVHFLCKGCIVREVAGGACRKPCQGCPSSTAVAEIYCWKGAEVSAS